MELSERILRHPPKKCAWSPALRNSGIVRRYWMLRLREQVRHEDYSLTFHRWQTSVQLYDESFCLPLLGTPMTVPQIRQQLTASNNSFRALQKRSIPLRLRTNQELLETYQDDYNPSTKVESLRKARILRNTIDGESIRRVFGNLRSIVKPSESSNLAKLQVPSTTDLDSTSLSSYRITQDTPLEDILWETVIDRTEIDRHLLQYNRDSFRAASSSRCGHGVIHDALTFSSLSSESVSLLSGTIPDDWCGSDNHLRECLASFVIPSNVLSHDKIPTSISETDILHGFKG